MSDSKKKWEDEAQTVAENQETAVTLSQARSYNLADLSASESIAYFSGTASTQAEKVALYNATSNPDFRVKDEINVPIEVKDIYVHIVELPNDETGEIQPAPRIILIDTKGKSHVAVSQGVYNSVARIFNMVGEPKDWETPIKVVPLLINKGTRSLLTLALK